MDFTTFLAPVGPDHPSGVELRSDGRFDELVDLLRPASRSARLSGAGDRVDWSEVFDKAAALAHEGRDLRLLVIVMRAAVNLEGVAGLSPGLDLLTETLEQFWDDLHPQLRERSDPREAAVGRINALKQLENGENGLLGDLKLFPVLSPRGIGPITGEDLADAAITQFEALNEAASGLGEKERAKIAARHQDRTNRVTAATRALAAEAPERAADLGEAIDRGLASLHALSAKLSEKVGLGNGASIGFPDLERLLTRMRTSLARASATAEASSEASSSLADAPAAGTIQTSSPSAPGGINSRADVERCLDAIIAFYERTEPSSPIPHLARRMRRMVPMDFLELMAEIAPSGMKEFKSVAGVGDEKPRDGKRSEG